jgi:hypothetical protein
MRIAIALLAFLSSPAFAGTVTCAGKTYRDITYAQIEPVGYTEIVRLWVGEVIASAVRKRAPAKFTIVLNTEVICEMEDVELHVAGDGE